MPFYSYERSDLQRFLPHMAGEAGTFVSGTEWKQGRRRHVRHWRGRADLWQQGSAAQTQVRPAGAPSAAMQVLQILLPAFSSDAPVLPHDRLRQVMMLWRQQDMLIPTVQDIQHFSGTISYPISLSGAAALQQVMFVMMHHLANIPDHACILWCQKHQRDFVVMRDANVWRDQAITTILELQFKWLRPEPLSGLTHANSSPAQRADICGRAGWVEHLLIQVDQLATMDHAAWAAYLRMVDAMLFLLPEPPPSIHLDQLCTKLARNIAFPSYSLTQNLIPMPGVYDWHSDPRATHTLSYLTLWVICGCSIPGPTAFATATVMVLSQPSWSAAAAAHDASLLAAAVMSNALEHEYYAMHPYAPAQSYQHQDPRDRVFRMLDPDNTFFASWFQSLSTLNAVLLRSDAISKWPPASSQTLVRYSMPEHIRRYRQATGASLAEAEQRLGTLLPPQPVPSATGIPNPASSGNAGENDSAESAPGLATPASKSQRKRAAKARAKARAALASATAAVDMSSPSQSLGDSSAE